MTTEQMEDAVVTAAERAVLGAAMHSLAALDECAAVITGRDFRDPNLEAIWNAIVGVAAQGTNRDRVLPDLVLVGALLLERGELERVGGHPALAALYAECVTTSNANYYARQVRKGAKDREARMVSARLAQSTAGVMSDEERRAVIAATIAALEDIDGGDGAAQPFVQAGTGFDPLCEVLEGGGPQGIPTGLHDLDRILGGLAGGQVIVAGARPAVGKSVWATQVGLNVARRGRTVLAFTLEMDALEVNLRLIGNLAQINSKALNRAAPNMQPGDWTTLSAVMPEFVDLPYWVCDAETLTPSRINAVIAAFKRSHPDLALVTIDYAQLINGDEKGSNRQEEVAQVSRAIKMMSKRYDVPIILLSQLNRNSESRTDRRPQMSDLRESGAYEQDADIVILLHREDQHDTESPRAGEMDCIVAKNRGGATGTAVVAAQLHYFRLVDLAYGSAAERLAA